MVSRLAGITLDCEIAFVDASADFAPDEQQLFSSDGRSLSAEGHARFARALARTVYELVPGVWTKQPAISPDVPANPDVARSPGGQPSG